MKLGERTILLQTNNPEEKCRLYKKRWFMLTIFVLCEISGAIVIPEYISIENTVMEYYNISHAEVNWSILIIMLIYGTFIFPSSYVINKLGLRKSLIVGIVGTSIGSWIKLIGVFPDSFSIVLLGQGIIAAMQALIIPISAQLAATWFGANEVSTACSIGIFTVPLSVAVGFLLPPLIANPSENRRTKSGLFVLNIAYAIFSTTLVIVTLLGFRECPPVYPTLAQAHRAQVQKTNEKFQSFPKIVKKLITNYSFVCLIFWYGINIGLFFTFNALLNQIILIHCPEASAYVGMVGFLINSIGGLGTISVGIFLDKFKQYKTTTGIISTFYVTSAISLFYLLDRGIYFVYAFGVLFGFFANCLLVLGIELGMELTYPIPETIIGGILNGCPQLLSIGFTYLYSYYLTKYNETTASRIFCSILLFANLLVIFIRFDLKRQNASTIPASEESYLTDPADSYLKISGTDFNEKELLYTNS